MEHKTILVVEDEPDIAELISFNLVQSGYDPKVVHSGEAVFETLDAHSVDMILLDLMLPKVSGLEICRRLKADNRWASLPILIVSAKGEEGDIVKGLEMGADDYVTKPFSPKVLLARIQAVFRRGTSTAGTPSGSALQADGLKLEPGKFEARLHGQRLELTHSEFRILQYLMEHPGWVFTRSQLVEAVHGKNYTVTDRAIDFQMVGLRKKLGDFGLKIETVRGVGYRFRDES